MEARVAYITLEGNIAIITFSGLCSNSIKELIKRSPWLKWQKRPNDKGKVVWHLIADLSRNSDVDWKGNTRIWQIVVAFMENGLFLLCRIGRNNVFSSDYKDIINLWESGPECPIPDISYVDLSTIICLDLETTGLYPSDGDEILQLSLIDGAGRVRFNEYICPSKKKNWEVAQGINGISPAMVQRKYTIEAHIDLLNSIINEANLIIGYNLHKFVILFLAEAGVEIPDNIKLFDVMDAYARLNGKWDRYKQEYRYQALSACSAHYHYDLKPHNSLEDAKAILHCFFAMKNERFRKMYDNSLTKDL